MELTTILWIFAIALIAYGYMKYTNRKKDQGKSVMAIGGLIVLLLFFSGQGSLAGLSLGGLDIDGNDVPIGSSCVTKLYTQVSVGTKTYGGNSYTTAAGTVRFFEEGVNPSDPNTNAIDTVTVTSGVGNTTNALLKSCTVYGIVFDGSTTYYDAWLDDSDHEKELPYVETDAATIANTVINFNKVIAFSTISDMLDETAVTGIINGQTNVSGEATSTNEIQAGTDSSPADDNALYYNETRGDGQFYLDITIAYAGGNTAVKNPVLCFVNDLSNPFDGNEFSSVTAQLRTGTNLGIPSSITNYVNSAGCIPLGSFVDGGVSSTYRLTFNLDESLTTAGGDIMYIYGDDLGKHLGQDILRGTKATASDAITLRTED